MLLSSWHLHSAVDLASGETLYLRRQSVAQEGSQRLRSNKMLLTGTDAAQNDFQPAGSAAKQTQSSNSVQPRTGQPAPPVDHAHYIVDVGKWKQVSCRKWAT